MGNLVVRFVSSSVLAVAWVIVWQQILYAGELPGEGFSASVLTILVLLLQFVVLGHDEASRRLPVKWFFPGLGVGVALLLALMAAPMAWGQAIFTTFKLAVGPVTLSSTTVFDIALFLVVSGGMLSAFIHLQEPGEPGELQASEGTDGTEELQP